MTSRSHAVWVDHLDPTEREVLDGAHAGTLSDSDLRPDVLVVGGGMVGLATALACQEAGLGRVVLLERDRLGGGATGGAAGILAPDAKYGVGPPDFVDLGRASLASWRRIDGSIAGGVELTDVDWLVPDPLPPGLDSRLPPGAVRVPELRSFDPGLASTGGGTLLPRQARLNPLRAAARLARQVGRVVTGVEVSEVACSKGRLAKVSTTAGELSPGVAVFTTGAPPSLSHPGLSPPCGYVKGHLVVTEPAHVRLRAAGDLATQLEDGSLMAGGAPATGKALATWVAGGERPGRWSISAWSAP